MQNTWITKLIFVICFFAFCHSASADSPKRKQLELILKDGSIISIARSGNKIVAESHNEKSNRFITISRKLYPHLLGARKKYLLFNASSNDRELFVVLARIPSNPNNSTGYCGAGYEDLLLLIEVENNEITLTDEFLLQSCSKSIYLISNKGGNPFDDPVKNVALDKEKKLINFEWLEKSEGTIGRTIYVEDGHFKMRSKEGAK